VRDRDNLAPRALEGTEGADGPFFSPDGRWIGYFAHGKLYKVAVDGHPPTFLADSATETLPGGAWLPNGNILFTGVGFGVLRVPAGGGPAETLKAPVLTGGGATFPIALPGSDRTLLTLCTNNCSRMTLVAYDSKAGTTDTLFTGVARAWYLPSGHLALVRQDGSVSVVRFNPSTLKIEGSPVPVLTGVQLVQGVTPELAVSADGTVIYRPGNPAGGEVTVVRVDRQGRASVLDPSWQAGINSLALSPDGRQLAVAATADSRTDLWVKQLDRGALTRLTFNGTLNYRPAWRPDGRSLSFTSDRDGPGSYLYEIRADGSTKPQRLLVGDTVQVDEAQWSADGRWLIYRVGVADGVRDVYARRVEGDTTRVTLAAGPYDEYAPTLSPDGRWLAYVSVESGREEVYVRPFPDAGRARWQVSTSGGTQPVWSHSGRELFYLAADDSLTSVAVGGGADFVPGARRALFSARGFVIQPFHQGYVVTPDDRSFIMFQGTSNPGGRSPNLTVILNWLKEIERKLQDAGGK
jgi:serine/threonine-protein kinase